MLEKMPRYRYYIFNKLLTLNFVICWIERFVIHSVWPVIIFAEPMLSISLALLSIVPAVLLPMPLLIAFYFF